MRAFNRYDNRWDSYGRQRSNEELDRMESEFYQEQKIKQKQIMRNILIGVGVFFTLTFLFFSCERIDAGHVGVKVNQYGDNKGVDDVVAVTVDQTRGVGGTDANDGGQDGEEGH